MRFRPATSAAHLLTAAAIATSAAILHACSAEQITHIVPPPPPPPPPAPPPPPPPPPDCSASAPNLAPGRYFLTRAGFSYLPFRIYENTSVLDSARIDLRLDSTYAFVQLHRAPHSGIHGVVTDSVNDSGTYSFCGTQIILTSSSAGHAQHQGAATASYFSLAVDSTLLAGSYLNYGFAVFASDLHQNVCGVEPPLTPPQASGEFGLRTLDGDSLPVTLIETDKTTVSISSAVFVMHAPRYSVQAIGKTSRSGDSTVVVVADSGEVQTCGGAMKLATSMVRDTAFLIESRDTLIAMPLAPDFVGYMYSQTYFAYLDPPMKLIFTPNR